MCMCVFLNFECSNCPAEAVSERVSTEHAQFEHSNKVAMETLQQEKEDLQSQLQQRSDENAELSKYVHVPPPSPLTLSPL